MMKSVITSLIIVTDSSNSYEARVNPETVPENITPSNKFFSILTRNHSRLLCSYDQTFLARIRLQNGGRVELASKFANPGEWHHVVIAMDDENRKLHLFIDEVEVDNSPVEFQGDLPVISDAPNYIGISDSLTEHYENRFHGVIDELRVYSEALEESYVIVLYTLYSGA